MNEWKKISTVAERLQEAMRICHKRQTDLAEETGIAKGTISNYINGKYEPKAPTIAKLAKALNCSEMWVMGFNVPMDRYAYVDPSDAKFLDTLPQLYATRPLPPELEALNTLLSTSGRQITQINGKYFFDECGLLTDDEVNELINSIIISVKSTTDILIAKKTKELRNFLKNTKKT